MTDLGTLGGTTSSASGINNSGEIVGYATTAAGATHATTWENGTITDLDPNGTTGSQGFSINNLGQVAGVIGSTDPLNAFGTVATLWSGGTVTTLMVISAQNDNGSQAYGINDSGEIVGSVYNPTVMHDFPVVWPSSVDVYTPLQYAGYGGEALAINSSNAIVGQVLYSVGSDNENATAWSSGGIPTRLTSLDGGGASSAAYGINASGEIVGTDNTMGTARATFWLSSSAPAVDLNTALRPSVASTVTLTEATGINVNGLIVATGTITATGVTHAFLLTPATMPGLPTATLSATPTSVTVGQSFTVNWSSTNTWACSADGTGPNGPPWSGPVATSGSMSIAAGATGGTLTLTLTCSFGNQSATAQTAVTVRVTQNKPSSGGGGVIDPWFLLGLLGGLGTALSRRGGGVPA
jgi:probable HAF family extracellular repeat protein